MIIVATESSPLVDPQPETRPELEMPAIPPHEGETTSQDAPESTITPEPELTPIPERITSSKGKCRDMAGVFLYLRAGCVQKT
ncbi:MAG: hypothetical protein DDT22_00231 [candidate division WS2 bacterium]|nr:hypothetical protein [Candidatus Lithacetigena glycinireducens]